MKEETKKEIKPTHKDRGLIKARNEGLTPKVPYPKWMIDDIGVDEDENK